MAGKEMWEPASLAWVHRVREEHYHKTKDLPVEAWLKPLDPAQALRASRRLGLNVKPVQSRKRAELRAHR